MKTERTRVLEVRNSDDDGFWAREVERAEVLLEATFPARIEAWAKRAEEITAWKAAGKTGVPRGHSTAHLLQKPERPVEDKSIFPTKRRPTGTRSAWL